MVKDMQNTNSYNRLVRGLINAHLESTSYVDKNKPASYHIASLQT
jgi:hypothetical protein